MLRSHPSRILAAGVFALAAIAGFATVSIGGDRLPMRAAPGEATYLLSNLTVEYPHGDESTAGVTWSSTLADSVLPGKVECVLEVSDAKGDVVGSTVFTYTLIGSDSGSHSPTPVSVQGVPVEAAGYCAAPEEGAGVEIGKLSVDPKGDMAHLVAEVFWSGQRPGEQFCIASLESPEGGLTELPFTFDPTEIGATAVTLLGDPLEDSVPTALTCKPLAGTDLSEIEAAVTESK